MTFKSRFGDFGDALADALGEDIANLVPLIFEEGDEFENLQAEINNKADEVFTEFANTFAQALAGILAFHGGEGIATGSTPAQATVAMAANASNWLSQIFRDSLTEAERFVSEGNDLLDELNNPE
jgi:hypothetical protein